MNHEAALALQAELYAQVRAQAAMLQDRDERIAALEAQLARQTQDNG